MTTKQKILVVVAITLGFGISALLTFATGAIAINQHSGFETQAITSYEKATIPLVQIYDLQYSLQRVQVNVLKAQVHKEKVDIQTTTGKISEWLSEVDKIQDQFQQRIISSRGRDQFLAFQTTYKAWKASILVNPQIMPANTNDLNESVSALCAAQLQNVKLFQDGLTSSISSSNKVHYFAFAFGVALFLLLSTVVSLIVIGVSGHMNTSPTAV